MRLNIDGSLNNINVFAFNVALSDPLASFLAHLWYEVRWKADEAAILPAQVQSAGSGTLVQDAVELRRRDIRSRQGRKK